VLPKIKEIRDIVHLVKFEKYPERNVTFLLHLVDMEKGYGVIDISEYLISDFETYNYWNAAKYVCSRTKHILYPVVTS
jgi:hypothetical protein